MKESEREMKGAAGRCTDTMKTCSDPRERKSWERKRNPRTAAPRRSEMRQITPVFLALSGELKRPKPGANVLVGVWERLIRTRSKRF